MSSGENIGLNNLNEQPDSIPMSINDNNTDDNPALVNNFFPVRGLYIIISNSMYF